LAASQLFCFNSAWANSRKKEKRRERRQFFGPPATHHIVALVAAKNWMAPIAMPSSGIIFTSFIRVFFCFPTQKQMKTPTFPGLTSEHQRSYNHSARTRARERLGEPEGRHPPRGLCDRALPLPKNSRSFSTVREFFSAKRRNPTQRHASTRASG